MPLAWGDVKTLVTHNLGKVSGGVVDDTIETLLPIWAKLFQQTVVQDRNYWFLRANATLPISAASQVYPLPPGFSEGMTMYLIFTNPKSFVELRPLSNRQDVIRQYAPVVDPTDKQQPSHYMVKNTEFELWPWPDQNYTLGADFWGDLTEPSGAPDFTNYLIESFPDLYVNYLTMLGFRYLQEMEDAGVYQQVVLRSVADLRARHVARVLGTGFVLHPRTDVYGDSDTERGNQWVTYAWGG